MYQRPVDIVYTWVDGEQEAFKDALTHYTQAHMKENPPTDRSGQWRDLEEIRYSLRSVHSFMPWVRRIYIVTNGQRPKYIKEDTDKVRFVDHSEIYPHPEDLPTFNSLSIECHLHNIEGLSEYFIYFNNDCFVGRSANRGDFIDLAGNETFHLETPVIPCEKTEHSHIRLLNHNARMLDEVFRCERRLNVPHTPQLYIKGKCQDVWSFWKDDLDKTSRSRLRRDDICFFRFLYTYLSIGKRAGAAPLQSIINKDYLNVWLSNPHVCFVVNLSSDFEETTDGFANLDQINPLFFCIQDHMWTDFDAGKNQIKRYLESRFPDASPWEVS